MQEEESGHLTQVLACPSPQAGLGQPTLDVPRHSVTLHY